MRRILLNLALVAVLPMGCGPALFSGAIELNLRAPEPAAFPESPAVYLLRDHRILLVNRWRSSSHSLWHRRDVIAILTEKGAGYADVRVPYDADAKIVDFSARTISPDGVSYEVEATRVFDDLATDTEDDDADTKVRVFSLPRVRPGSVIDYSYTIESRSLSGGFQSFIADSIPVKRFALSLEGTHDIKYSVKAYNTNSQWVTEDLGETWRLRFDMENIPASESGKRYAQNREQAEPWWAFRISQLAKINIVIDINRDWSSALRWRANALVVKNDEFYAGFDPKLETPPSPCDAKCRVESLLAYSRRDLPFSGFGSWPGRPAKKVADRGQATGVEKTRILWWLLKKANVTAHFAFTHALLEKPADFDFPLPTGLPRLILFVPKQPGVSEDVFVDPSCEYCRVGEVPYWLTGSEALVIKKVETPFGHTRPEAQLDRVKVTGTVRDQEARRHQYDVSVARSGDTRFSMTVEATGRCAQDEKNAVRSWTPLRWREHAESLVAKHQMGSLSRLSDFRIEGALDFTRYTVSSTAAAYSAVDDEAILVPLGFLRTSWDELPFEDVRTVPIVFRNPYAFEETAIVRPPAGYALTRLPEPLRLDNKYFTASLTSVAEGATVKITRVIRTKPGVYPAAELQAMRAAFDAYSSPRQKFVEFASKR
ncbi:MAG: DUF3857 domain-containing protein [Deltaproteobacteria bacterium]|nr:DUF3857 domain-containing protein [Deltaproteobacteria bacterium]